MAIDLGRVGEQIKNRFEEVVHTGVEEIRATVARFIPTEQSETTATQADTALHQVALRVAVGGPQPDPLTPEERQRIERGVDAVFQKAGYGYPNAAVELAKQLRGQSSEYQAEFIASLYRTSPAITSDILRGAGGERRTAYDAWPTESDQYTIARAIGDAYDKHLLPADFVQSLLDHDEKFSLPPNNEYTANIIAQSGSKDLINAFIDKSLEYATHEGEWMSSFNLGAARAMAGDPQIMQERLAKMSEAQLQDFIRQIDPDRYSRSIAGYDDTYTNALATFVRGAAKIEPPTEGVLNLFLAIAGQDKDHPEGYMDRPGVADAMGELFTSGYTEYLRWPNGKIEETVFHSNAEFFMHRMMMSGVDPKTGRPIDEDKQVTAMVNFFQHTIFNENSEYKDAVSRAARDTILSLQSAIKYYPGVDSRTRELIDRTIVPEPGVNAETSIKEQLAYRLGRFTGTIFEGFDAAVRARNAENANIDGAVDFLFSMVPTDKAIDLLKGRVPGIGTLVGQGANIAIDKAKELTKEWLHKKDLNEDRQEIWQLFMEFGNNVDGYYSENFYNGALAVQYITQRSGR